MRRVLEWGLREQAWGLGRDREWGVGFDPGLR